MQLVDLCYYYEGKKYGYFKIVAHALDKFIGGRYFFRRLCFMDNYPICSWLVAHVYSQLSGLQHYFGVPNNACQPDDIEDFCTGRRSPFKEVKNLRL